MFGPHTLGDGKIHRQQQAHEEKKVVELFRGHSKVVVEEGIGDIFSHLFYKHVTIIKK